MSRSPHLIAATMLFLAALSTSFRALSDEVSEVTRLHRAGQTEAALQRAQRFVATKPDDARMQFLLGVMLSDGQRKAEAIDVFLKLSLDHPELAEVHNNLAALYAAAGDFDRARAALETALRANPSYAAAQENLGDVYAALASQAYSRAVKLDPDNSRLLPKIALVRDLFTPVNGMASVPVKTSP